MSREPLHAQHHSHQGLAQDLHAYAQLQEAQRRRMLHWLAGTALVAPLGACGGGGGASGTAASTTTSDSAPVSSTSCTITPSETAGPYPGDGTNTANGSLVNVLTQSGVERRDITGSFGTASGTAGGVALTVRLSLVNSTSSCAARANHAVYLWHCDALGRYSLYSSGATTANYLRGVQVSDSTGVVEFTTIVPGCYAGRWPHMHFEIYSTLASATSGSNDIKTSQLALPVAICNPVYATSAYTGSATNLAAITLASDGVFSDGVSTQMATVTGSVSAGYVATLQVSV